MSGTGTGTGGSVGRPEARRRQRWPLRSNMKQSLAVVDILNSEVSDWQRAQPRLCSLACDGPACSKLLEGTSGSDGSN